MTATLNVEALPPTIEGTPALEYAGELARPDLMLQLPADARDDFVATVEQVIAGEDEGPVLFKTMQFEVNKETRPIYGALQDAQAAGVDTRFYYDRVARQHIRVEGDPRSQAWQLGRFAVRRGNKAKLKEAYTERELLIGAFEHAGISDPSHKERSSGQSRSTHDHIKIARAGSKAWLKTQNEREIDYRISNFSLRVTDPSWVEALTDIATQAERPHTGPDKIYTVRDETGETETQLLFDVGVPGQSVIYDTGMGMIGSLKEGDKAEFISQWPPVKVMFGDLVTKLRQKAAAGAEIHYLISPEEDLHPTKLGSRMLQRSVKKREQREANTTVTNLARPTHVKGLLITRKDGSKELLTGTNNLAERTVKNGTCEVAIWTKNPQVISQYEAFMSDLVNERLTNV